MHGLGKIFAVKNFDFIPPPLQKAAYLSENTSFGIDHHIAASGLFIRAGLQDLRGKPEPGFAGAGRADILKFVDALISNTKGEGKEGDPFWQKAETLLYCALIAYIIFEGPAEDRNMNTLVDMISGMEVKEDDENFQNAVDYMFKGLEKRKPDCFAVKQYKKYKLASGVVCSKRLLNQAVGKSLRTHNLKPKKGAQVMRKNEKITALYERLSRDDFGKDDDQQRESNSISNQKAMLEDFATRQGFTNIVHFTDDGISGTCFDRPGFLAMMKEVEAGNVEYLCIIFAKVITAQSFVQSCDFLVFSHNLRSFLRF